jgi:hypothetical protein
MSPFFALLALFSQSSGLFALRAAVSPEGRVTFYRDKK